MDKRTISTKIWDDYLVQVSNKFTCEISTVNTNIGKFRVVVGGEKAVADDINLSTVQVLPFSTRDEVRDAIIEKIIKNSDL